MRRSALAVIGIAAVLAIAACSPDQPRREPLAPTDAGFAKSGGGGGSLLCAGSQLSEISKQQKALFSTAVINTDFDPLLTALKNACPVLPTSLALMTYIQNVINNKDPITINGTFDADRAEKLVNLWKAVTQYAVDPLVEPPLDRSPEVFNPGTPPTENASFGVRGGGADVLDGDNGDDTTNPPTPASSLYDLYMFTWDNQAGFKISNDQKPLGPHLITLTPAPCSATSLLLTGGCYDVESYPEVGKAGLTWDPNINFGQCARNKNTPTAAISHYAEGYGTEVLPTGESFPWAGSLVSCVNTHNPLTGWLRREAGPLGRVLASAYDYLRPRPLFADDAGESGQAPSDSPFGAVLQASFDDPFTGQALGALPDGDIPPVGDNWYVQTPHPSYARIENGWTGFTNPVLVMSQALGNCELTCPAVFALAGRSNLNVLETIGTWDVEWRESQNKSSVKEAPMVIRNFDGVEIVRLSYVTVSSTNSVLLKINNGLDNNGAVIPPTVVYAGTWFRDDPKDYKITVKLQQTRDGANQKTVSLYVGGVEVTGAQNRSAPFATSIGRFGFYLEGIDAGIIVSDNFKLTRQFDNP